MNILLGVTGSVAAKLIFKLVGSLRGVLIENNVKVVVTNSAKTIISEPTLVAFDDDMEWDVYKTLNNVLHIDLAKWADVFVIAPCSANTLAKMANGICDNLLTCCVRAWDYNRPMIIAPAMNTQMYLNPFTQKHLDVLKEMRVIVVPPQTKELYCGDVGIGAMAEISDIVSEIEIPQKRIKFPPGAC